MNITSLVEHEINIAQQHLVKADKSYCEHLAKAIWFSYKCFSAGCLAAIHGFFPNVFHDKGTDTIDELYFILHPKLS